VLSLCATANATSINDIATRATTNNTTSGTRIV
jgi:hypothetical protein